MGQLHAHALLSMSHRPLRASPRAHLATVSCLELAALELPGDPEERGEKCMLNLHLVRSWYDCAHCLGRGSTRNAPGCSNGRLPKARGRPCGVYHANVPSAGSYTAGPFRVTLRGSQCSHGAPPAKSSTCCDHSPYRTPGIVPQFSPLASLVPVPVSSPRQPHGGLSITEQQKGRGSHLGPFSYWEIPELPCKCAHLPPELSL